MDYTYDCPVCGQSHTEPEAWELLRLAGLAGLN